MVWELVFDTATSEIENVIMEISAALEMRFNTEALVFGNGEERTIQFTDHVSSRFFLRMR